MESREERLDAVVRRLLDCCELNMDDMEEETREAIRAVLLVLDGPEAANAPDDT